MSARPLSPKQAEFARHIFEGRTQADAYRRAYGKTSKVKDATCFANASKLLHITKVKDEIRRLQAMAQDKSVLSMEVLLAVLAEIILTPAGKLTEDARIAQEVVLSEYGASVKMPSKIAAIDLSCKLLGLYQPKRHELTGANGEPLQVEAKLEDIGKARMDELARLIAKQRGI